MPDDVLKDVRVLCLALPEAAEKPDGWSPTFQVRGKTFAQYVDNHHGDRRKAVWCRAAPGVQDALVAHDPIRFYVPPYMGNHGWVAVRVDVPVDWRHLEAVVTEAYRLSAPKTLAATLGPSNGVDFDVEPLTGPAPEPPPNEHPRPDLLEQMRAICLALPESGERESFGKPWFHVRGKGFANYDYSPRTGSEVSFWCKSTIPVQDELISARPDVFFVPPYIGGRGWVAMRLDDDTDWEMAAGVLREGYRLAAPKKLAALV